MSKRLLLIAALVFFGKASFAQLIGGNCYLQGHYLEIGMCPNGSFGACGTPAGYHEHLFGGGTGALAEVYDYGHDGWTVGTPPFMGDYTYPGSPFEGWEVQINGGRGQAYEGCAGGYSYSGGGAFASAGLTTYSNSGGVIIGNWAGNFSAGGSQLVLRQETRVDTNASAVVVTTHFYNTTGSAVPGVYYWRSCDPDNDETWTGGSFTTINTIVHQNEDDTHRVLVNATGTGYSFATLGLGTRDCRAVCCIYSSWGLVVSQDLAAVWGRTYGATYTLGASVRGDVAIGLVYNLGTIAAGDSSVISYSYIFDGNNGIDTVFPNPELVVNGVPVTAYPDTFNVCSFPGMTVLPVSVIHGSDRNWTNGKWTWSPGTGLSSTTGIDVSIDLTTLPGDITYTVTGTDSAAGSMTSCNTAFFVFTVHNCHGADNNRPCVGDTLRFKILGDTSGATYVWYGPGGTYTGYDPYIYPATFSDSGLYHLVKTIAGISDTDTTYVNIHPLPVMNVTSNQALCAAMVSTLDLSILPYTTNETFLWSGPNGFTSTLELPTITGFDSADAGIYYVNAVSQFGCRNSGSVAVWPGIVANFAYTIHRGCVNDEVDFFNTSSNGNSYSWSFGDGSYPDSNRNTSHTYTTQGQWTVTLTVTNAHCSATVSYVVDTRHTVTAAFAPSPDTFCVNTATTVTNNSTTTLAGSASSGLNTSYWNFGDGSSDGSTTPLPHTYTAAGVYRISLAVTDTIGCADSTFDTVYVMQIHVTSFNDTMLCISMPLPLTNVITQYPPLGIGYSYSWTQSSPNLSDTTVQIPTLSGFGMFTDILTVTMPGVSPDGCPVEDTFNVHSVLGVVIHDMTASATIALGESIQLNADSEAIYRWTPNDGSLDNPNISNPVATPNVTTTYTVFGYDVNGCLDSASVTIYVDTTMLEYMPSGFTPNGDGKNDVFAPVGIQFQRMVDFRVFNRWGQQVFYSNNYKVGWDGTYNGVPQDMGVYYYVITVARPAGSDGQNVTYKGNITLIR